MLNFYKNNLEDIINNNINNKISIKTKYISYLAKKNILFLFKLFNNNNKAINSRNNILNQFLIDN